MGLIFSCEANLRYTPGAQQRSATAAEVPPFSAEFYLQLRGTRRKAEMLCVEDKDGSVQHAAAVMPQECTGLRR